MRRVVLLWLLWHGVLPAWLVLPWEVSVFLCVRLQPVKRSRRGGDRHVQLGNSVAFPSEKANRKS